MNGLGKRHPRQGIGDGLPILDSSSDTFVVNPLTLLAGLCRRLDESTAAGGERPHPRMPWPIFITKWDVAPLLTSFVKPALGHHQSGAKAPLGTNS